MEVRRLVTQDRDLSDLREFQPGTHAGLLLVRLCEPGANELARRLAATAAEISNRAGCFVVLTDHKIRVKRSYARGLGPCDRLCGGREAGGASPSALPSRSAVEGGATLRRTTLAKGFAPGAAKGPARSAAVGLSP